MRQETYEKDLLCLSLVSLGENELTTAPTLQKSALSSDFFPSVGGAWLSRAGLGR